MSDPTHGTIEAVWPIESARLIGDLAGWCVTLALPLVSKTSPKPWRIPGNSRGLEGTQLLTEGVIAEPLTDESRAPSVCWKSGPNESPLRHQ